MSRIGRLLACAFAAVALSQAPAALTQSVPPPPLLQGEVLYPTASGCAIILHYERPETATEAATNRQFYAKAVWRGGCRHGLAHGAGTIQFPNYSGNAWTSPTSGDAAHNYTYDYGRLLGRVVTTGQYANITYIALGGRSGSRDGGDPLTPRWNSAGGADSHIRADGWLATTFKTTCYTDRQQFPDCSSDNTYDVYGMWVYRPADTQGAPPTIWCPNPKTPVGCETLWRTQSASIYASYQAIVAEVERDLPAWRNQLAQLNAPREAQIAALETARREAAIREQLEQAEAEAKAEAAFQSTVTKGNAGQLFALADELREAGKAAKSREVLRTLVSRFPEHPLAANAAQQLSQMGAAPAAPSYSRPSAAAPAASASSSYRPPSSGVNEASCQAEVNRLADALTASRSRTANNVVAQMETLMFVLKAMAETTDAMCPRTQAYINASAGFRKTFDDTARTCGQTSSQGACTPRMH